MIVLTFYWLYIDIISIAMADYEYWSDLMKLEAIIVAVDWTIKRVVLANHQELTVMKACVLSS